MKIYLRIITYIKKYKKYIFLSVIMSLLFSVFSALSIYLTIPLLKTLFTGTQTQTAQTTDNLTGFYQSIQKVFEDFILSGSKESAILKVSLLILAAFFLKNITGFFQSVFMQYVEKGVLRDIRFEMYEKVNKLSIRYFTQEKAGNLISRMTNDINNIQSGISAAFSNLIKDPLLILIFLILSLSISWQMTLMSFTVFPITVLVVAKIGSSLRRRSLRVQVKLSELLSVINETIYGAKIIRSFRAEKYRNEVFRKENNEHYKLLMKTSIMSELASPITEFLTILAGVIIIWFGGREILIHNNLRPEEFLGFIFILFQLIVPIKNLSSVSNRIQESAASGQRIFEILDYPIEVKDANNPIDYRNFTKDIELKNVSFYYDANKYILKDINLRINKSEIIAIVGPSGSGKSTLADLIARFYDVTEGEILFDGINLKNIKFEQLRDLIGIVPQETILFNDTVRNNIVFGMENITDEELRNAAKNANALEFIEQLDKGFDSIVGERGLKLSGGQKQRIAIARALLRNPQILILDEATSSLDTESERIVQEAIDNLMANRTSIVIAHRLSTIKNADKIAVIAENGISQVGTHDELMKDKNGLYKRLYEIQFNSSN
ncbi:MAG: ABC transporter ATP-binding protein [Candidatus Kapaibacterium sp.]